MDKLKFETPDLAAENLKKLEALFPSAITEMRGQNGTIRKGVNFELLKQLLSPDVVDGEECYELNWVGKRAAMAEAAQPITKTLRPMQEDSRDWDKTENLYLEGDNLDVLKILQESYLGQVKMIYIDPPYNTGHDFLYRDKYQRSQREENEQMGMYDEEENRLFENTESNGKFHSDWCSILYARLLVCRNLLRDDGVIFISIDNNEFANLRSICDSVFGRSSFVSVLHVQMSTVQGQKVRAAKAGNIVKNAEMVLIYSKNGNKTIGLRPMLDAVKYDNHYNKILRPNPDGSYCETPLTDAAAQEPEIVSCGCWSWLTTGKSSPQTLCRTTTSTRPNSARGSMRMPGIS